MSRVSDITWTDITIDSKLRIIERELNISTSAAGAPQDYTVNDKPKELLLDYCRYVRSNALSEFQQHYLPELLTLRMRQEVADYEAENADPDV